MAFEIFERRRMPSKVLPAVTIQRRGALSLNATAFEAIGSPDFVELLYDRDKRLIGIRGSNEGVGHAYGIRGIGENEATHVISGKAFLAYYDISHEVALRWLAEIRDDLLVIDLKQPGTEVSGHSSRAHQGGD